MSAVASVCCAPCTEGSRQLILCLVRPMRRILTFAAVLLLVPARLDASGAEIVIHRSDVTSVAVNGTSVTVSAVRIPAAAPGARMTGFALRFACVVAAVKDMSISGASFGELSLAVTLKFPDPASAATFAASVTRETSREQA